MSSPPPLNSEHRVRVSALEQEYTWRLAGDTLWMCTEGQADIPIPLASVARVRLSFDPSRMQRNRFRCHLHNANVKCGTIQNISYKGIADFEDRSATYNSLIRALIPRIAAMNPGCVFKTGTSHLNWWAQFVFLLAAFSLLAFVIFVMYSAIGWMIIVKLLIIAFFIPVVISWFTRNLPRTFDPKAIPERLLPK